MYFRVALLCDPTCINNFEIIIIVIIALAAALVVVVVIIIIINNNRYQSLARIGKNYSATEQIKLSPHSKYTSCWQC